MQPLCPEKVLNIGFNFLLFKFVMNSATKYLYNNKF